VREEMAQFKSAYQVMMDEMMSVLRGQSKEIESLRKKLNLSETKVAQIESEIILIKGRVNADSTTCSPELPSP
jgi:hypothetical protein